MFDSPPPSAKVPAVVIWFKVYCGFLAVIYAVVSLVGLPFLLIDPQELEMEPIAARFIGVLFLGLGLVLLVLSLLPLFLAPRPWVWIYDLVLICLGMTSACFLFFSIPLLIFWLRPEVKQYFGRTGASG